MKESGILIRVELNIDDGQPVNPIAKDALKRKKMNDVMMPTRLPTLSKYLSILLLQ
jgi:hypothetical protein